jgi:hypothetical protein
MEIILFGFLHYQTSDCLTNIHNEVDIPIHMPNLGIQTLKSYTENHEQ